MTHPRHEKARGTGLLLPSRKGRQTGSSGTKQESKGDGAAASVRERKSDRKQWDEARKQGGRVCCFRPGKEGNGMAAVSIISVLAFSTIASFIQIPRMLSEKAYRDIWAFSILLLLGTTLAVLVSLDIPIPNPSDWVAWVYKPVSDFFKDFLK